LSLLDAFDEGQFENYAQTVHSAVSLKRLLSCYVTNMIDENRDCRGRGRLADASFTADVRFAPTRRIGELTLDVSGRNRAGDGIEDQNHAQLRQAERTVGAGDPCRGLEGCG